MKNIFSAIARDGRTLFIQQNETKRKFTGVSNRVCKKKKKRRMKKKKKNDRDKFKRI